MITFDDVTKENIKENNLNWPEILDHPCRILIVEVLDLEKQMRKSWTRYWDNLFIC